MPSLKISELPATTATPQLNAELAMAQNGVTYKVTVQQLASAIGSVGTPTIGAVNVNSSMIGNGTNLNPLGVKLPLPANPIAGTFLGVTATGNLKWMPITAGSGGGDNWGNQVVETDSSLTGDGTTASPLKVATPSVNYSGGLGVTINGSNQIIHKSGSQGHRGDVYQYTNSMNLIVTRIRGRRVLGTLPTQGQVLTWNNGWWRPMSLPNTTGDDWGNQTVVSDTTLSGNGTVASPLKITTPYIPLSGTPTGSPVTGNIEFTSGRSLYSGTSTDYAHLQLNGFPYADLYARNSAGDYGRIIVRPDRIFLQNQNPRIYLQNTSDSIAVMANNIALRSLNTTKVTSIRLGLKATDKIGFFDKIPIVQQSAPTGNNGAKINGLIAILKNFGLIA